MVFGKASGFAAEIDLAAVAAGNGGFVIHGQDVRDQSGTSVSSAGDINGDGFDDLIIGAELGYGRTLQRPAGDSYVVFGHAGTFRRRSTLLRSRAATAASPSMARMLTISPAGRCPWTATLTATASTIIIGAYGGDGPGNSRAEAGDSYVVFGHAGGFAAEIDLSASRPATAAS